MSREFRVSIEDLRRLVEDGQEVSSNLFRRADEAEESVLVHLEMIQRGTTKLKIGEATRVEADLGILGVLGLQQPLLKIGLTVELGRMIRDGLSARVLSEAATVGQASLSAAELQKAAREYGRRREAIRDAERQTVRALSRLGRQEQRLLAAPTETTITEHLSTKHRVLQQTEALAAYRRRLEVQIDRAYDTADEEGVPEEVQIIAAVSGMKQADVPDDHLKFDPETLPTTTKVAIALAEHVRFE